MVTPQKDPRLDHVWRLKSESDNTKGRILVKEDRSKIKENYLPTWRQRIKSRIAITYSRLTTSSSSEDDAVSSRSRAIMTGISFRVCHAVSRQEPQRPFLAHSLDQTIWVAQIPARETKDLKRNAAVFLFIIAGDLLCNENGYLPKYCPTSRGLVFFTVPHIWHKDQDFIFQTYCLSSVYLKSGY